MLCDWEYICEVLATWKFSDGVEALKGCDDAIYWLLYAYNEFSYYVVEWQYDLLLKKVFRYIYSFMDRGDFVKQFRAAFDNTDIGEDLGFYGVVEAFRQLGYSEMDYFLRDLNAKELDEVKEIAAGLLDSLSEDLDKPIWDVKHFFRDDEGFKRTFFELGIPENIVDGYLDELVKAAVFGTLDWLLSIYAKPKAWGIMYGEGVGGIQERLLEGYGVGEFLNRVLISSMDPRDKVEVFNSVTEYISNSDISSGFSKLEIPFVRYILTKNEAGLLENYDFPMIFSYSTGIFGLGDRFFTVDEIREAARLFVERLYPSEAAVYVSYMYGAFPIEPNVRVVNLNKLNLDDWGKAVFAITSLILKNPLRFILEKQSSDLARSNGEDEETESFYGDEVIDRIFKVLQNNFEEREDYLEIYTNLINMDIHPNAAMEHLYTTNVQYNRFVGYLLDYLDMAKDRGSIGEYIELLYFGIPKRVLDVPVKSLSAEFIARTGTLLAYIAKDSVWTPSRLIFESLNYLFEKAKHGEELKIFRAYVDAKKEELYSENEINAALKALVENTEKIGKRSVISILEGFRSSTKAVLRKTALKGLYSITGDETYLEIALEDDAKSIRNWAKKQLKQRNKGKIGEMK
ncbi:MAG: hypothetical protein ACP6IP_04300 [Candidatus Njordarchaeia archaeon]